MGFVGPSLSRDPSSVLTEREVDTATTVMALMLLRGVDDPVAAFKQARSDKDRLIGKHPWNIVSLVRRECSPCFNNV
jgi:hypothetical protein